MITSAVGGVNSSGSRGGGGNNGYFSKPHLSSRKGDKTGSGSECGVNDRRKISSNNGNSVGCGHQLFPAKGGERCYSVSSGSSSELDSFAAVKPRFRAKEKLYVNISEQCDEDELQNWTTDEDYFNANK